MYGKKNIKALIFLILWLLLLILACVIKFPTKNKIQAEHNVLIEVPEGKVLKTVAHLDANNINSNFKLIAYDAETDTALYEVVNDLGIDKGDMIITLDGVAGTVTYLDINGFAFIPEEGKEVPAGTSGTAVRNVDGKQVGIISKTLTTGEIYCIWS